MDPALIEPAITSRTKAIMPVGIYGQCADMDAINSIAAKHGLTVIEDAAQSFGATYKGRRSGSLATIGSTSFFPSKPLGCYGDGGGLFTDDDELAERMRQIRVHGQERKHHHPLLGLNGRLDTLQAAILLAKLEWFDAECRERECVSATATTDYLHGQRVRAESTVVPPHIAEGNTSVYAQYTVLVDNRDAVQKSFGRRRYSSGQLLRGSLAPAAGLQRIRLHGRRIPRHGRRRQAFPESADVTLFERNGTVADRVNTTDDRQARRPERLMTAFIARACGKLGLLPSLNLVTGIRIRQHRFKIPIIGGVGMTNVSTSERWMVSLLERLGPFFANNPGAFIDVGVNVGQTLLKLRSRLSRDGIRGIRAKSDMCSLRPAIDRVKRLSSYTACTCWHI